MLTVFLLFISAIAIIKSDSESSETKYIDLLPDEEKREFINNIARRILEQVQPKVHNVGSSEVTDDQLDAHSAFISKLLKEERESRRHDNSSLNEANDENLKVQGINRDKSRPDDDEVVDLTLRAVRRQKRTESQEKERPVIDVDVDLTRTDDKVVDVDDSNIELNSNIVRTGLAEKEIPDIEQSSNIPVQLVYDDATPTKNENDLTEGKNLTLSETKKDELQEKDEDHVEEIATLEAERNHDIVARIDDNTAGEDLNDQNKAVTQNTTPITTLNLGVNRRNVEIMVTITTDAPDRITELINYDPAVPVSVEDSENSAVAAETASTTTSAITETQAAIGVNITEAATTSVVNSTFDVVATTEIDETSAIVQNSTVDVVTKEIHAVEMSISPLDKPILRADDNNPTTTDNTTLSTVLDMKATAIVNFTTKFSDDPTKVTENLTTKSDDGSTTVTEEPTSLDMSSTNSFTTLKDVTENSTLEPFSINTLITTTPRTNEDENLDILDAEKTSPCVVDIQPTTESVVVLTTEIHEMNTEKPDIDKILRQGVQNGKKPSVYDSKFFMKLRDKFEKGRPKKYEVYEIPSGQPAFIENTIKNPLREGTQDNEPYYVPIYNYSPNNAYFNPYNRLGPNFEEFGDRKALNADNGATLNKKDDGSLNLDINLKLDTGNTDIVSVLRAQNIKDSKSKRINIRRFNKRRDKPTKIDLPALIKALAKQKLKSQVRNENIHIKTNIFRSRHNKILRKLNFSAANEIRFPDSAEKDHAYNLIHLYSHENHLDAVRQIMYKQNYFGYVPERTTPKSWRTTRANRDKGRKQKMPRSRPEVDYPDIDTKKKVSTEDDNLIVLMSSRLGNNSKTDSTPDNNAEEVINGNIHFRLPEDEPTETQTVPTIQSEIDEKKDRIKEFLDFTDERDMVPKVVRLQKFGLDAKASVKSDEDIDVDVYVNVLRDIIRMGSNGLEKYDWLKTTVDIQAALEKLIGLAEQLQDNIGDMHPSDLQLIKYVIYIHKTSADSIKAKKLVEESRNKENVMLGILQREETKNYRDSREQQSNKLIKNAMSPKNKEVRRHYLNRRERERKIKKKNYFRMLNDAANKKLLSMILAARSRKNNRLVLPRGKWKKIKNKTRSHKGVFDRTWLVRNKESKKLILYDFVEFLEDLQDGLHDLHNALKHISLITKYKSQHWYKNLKELYLAKPTKKQLLELILHLSATRLIGLLEDSAGLVERDYKSYVEQNEQEVSRTRQEMVFVLKLLREIKNNLV